MRRPVAAEVLAVLAGGAAVGMAGRAGLRQRRKNAKDFAVDAARRLVAVGLVDAHSARIWLRTERPGRHTLAVTGPDGVGETARFDVPDDPARDGTFVIRWPSDVGAKELTPATRYTYAVRDDDGVLVGGGRFVTAPLGPDDARDEFSIAIASCHQPFDEDGTLRPVSMGLLGALETAFDALEVEQILLLGDQMYTDLPQNHSLFGKTFRRVAPPGRKTVLECSREEVRALLQERYRIFWQIESFQRLQANFSTLCTMDDHEVVDDFGSDPAHASPEWANFRAGAIDAFHDYQALRAHDRDPRPPHFATRFTRGPLAGLLLDLRTERIADDTRIRILGEDQWAILDRFLDEESSRPVLLLGLSVPIVHAPDWLVKLGGRLAPRTSDVHDRWSDPRAQPDLDRLLLRLKRHREAFPAQRIVLVGGDIHVGVVSSLQIGDSAPILQFVSSAISNLEKRLNRLASAALPQLRHGVDTTDGLWCRASLIPGVAGREQNPTSELNAGVLTVRRRADGWSVRLRIVGEASENRGHAHVVYDSGEL